MAKINMSKRKEAERFLYSVIDKLDPTGINTKRYREIFSSMSDKKFQDFMTDMWNDFNLNFTIQIEDFVREVDLDMCEAAAKVVGCPLEEFLIMPFNSMSMTEATLSKVPVIVGYHNEGRPQQMNNKKNSTSIHNTQRSAITNQVVGDDKNGRSSDVENIALTLLGADKILAELNGFRADGIKRSNFAVSQITTTGQCNLDEVEEAGGIEDRSTLNAVDMMFLGMHIKTNLVSKDYILISGKENV